MTEACSPKTPAYNEMHLEPILVWQGKYGEITQQEPVEAHVVECYDY